MNVKSILIVDADCEAANVLRAKLSRTFNVTLAESVEQAGLIVQASKFDTALISSVFEAETCKRLLDQIDLACTRTACLLMIQESDLKHIPHLINHRRVFGVLTGGMTLRDTVETIKQCMNENQVRLEHKREIRSQVFGAVAALSELLRTWFPLDYEAGVKAASIAGSVCDQLNIAAKCEIQLAALLTRIGLLRLSAIDREMYLQEHAGLFGDRNGIYSRSADLLRKIPKLEPVGRLVGTLDDQQCVMSCESQPKWEQANSVLQISIEFVKLTRDGLSDDEAVSLLASDPDSYCETVVAALDSALATCNKRSLRKLRIDELEAGMIIAVDVVTDTGKILVARDRTVSSAVLNVLRAPKVHRSVREPIFVYDANDGLPPCSDEMQAIAINALTP